MLYLAIPAQNEVATIGVLLWRLRTVLAEFPREYEVVVYDDASTDETADVAEQYVHAMPVTVLRGATPVGYAGAVDALVRHISAQTRYPRRDAMLLLQGDFTDPPGIVPEFARRFEGGADLVVGERTTVVDAPKQVKRLFSAANLTLRPFVRVNGIRDLTGSMRLVRISALRDLLRTAGNNPVCEGDTWTANADLLLNLIPHARRVESVPVEPTYGVRTRETRRVTVRDALATLRWGWRARRRRTDPAISDDAVNDAAASRPSRSSGSQRRRDEPEVTAERLRERSRERDRLRGDVDSESAPGDHRSERERSRGARTNEPRATTRADARREPSAEPRSRTREEPRTDARRESPAEVRKGRRDEPRDVAAKPQRQTGEPKRSRPPTIAETEQLLSEDPFAGPARTGGPRIVPATPVVPSAPLELPSSASRSRDEADEADVHDSPYAPSVADRNSRDARGGKTSVDSTGKTAESVEVGAEVDDADEADSETTTSDNADSDAVRERKRRRNRRSRRRKSKQRRGTSSTEESDSTDSTESPVTPRNGPRSEADTDSDDDAEGNAENDADESANGEAGETDGAENTRPSRSRRRGRRGRRGGNRRSRGRDDGDAKSEGSGDAPNDSPRINADPSPYREARDSNFGNDE